MMVAKTSFLNFVAVAMLLSTPPVAARGITSASFVPPTLRSACGTKSHPFIVVGPHDTSFVRSRLTIPHLSPAAVAFVPSSVVLSMKGNAESNSDNQEQEISQAEEDAAYDAHDCSDAGMEAAAEERAVMMAYEMAEKQQKNKKERQQSGQDRDGEDNVVPFSSESMNRAGDDEISQAEEDAAYDAHDCSDAGMEAAAEERAVVMAYEMAEKLQKNKKERQQSGQDRDREDNVVPFSSESMNRAGDDEIRQAEEDAAYDAHDCSDAGMEAAAEERAVVMAYEMAEKQQKNKKKQQQIGAGEEKGKQEHPIHLSMEKVDNDEISQAEEDAAYDAHDCSDAGMEAAAEERAVMMAYEMAEKQKDKNT